MKWNVYYHNINKKKIEAYNIFEHCGFCNDVKMAIKEYDNKDGFSKYVKTSLGYYFHYKAEWEIIVAPWCGGDRELDAIKIDVKDQVMNNWDIFIDYCWNNREELLVE